jgi:hypothetical protein
LALALIQGVAMLLYPFSAVNKQTFALTTMTLFFCLGGNFALFPAATMRLFGQSSGTNIYALLFSAFATSSVFGGILTKWLTSTVGWNSIFWVRVRNASNIVVCLYARWRGAKIYVVQVLSSMTFAALLISRTVTPLSFVPGSTI